MKMSERRKFQMERIGNAEALKFVHIWSVKKKPSKRPVWIEDIEQKDKSSIGDKKEVGREKVIQCFLPWLLIGIR